MPIPDDATRPYPAEHAARLRNPDDFDSKSFRRTSGGTLYGSIKVPATIGIVWGKLKGKAEASDSPLPQALRFPIENWTAAQARAWLKKNDVKFIGFEAAAGGKKAVDDSDIPAVEGNGKVCRAYFGEDENGAVRMSTLDKEKHTAEFIIATDAPVRDSLYSPPVSLSMREGAVVLKDYRRNPVVLAQHQHGVIEAVGRSLKVWTEGRYLVSRAQFDVDDELGLRTWGKIERGYLRAASIGYRKLRMREVEEGKTDSESGLAGPVSVATQWKLLEWSVVAVGADAESLGRSDDDASAVADNGAADDDGVKAFSLPDIPQYIVKL